MLWVKAFHLLFIISWFAGLFYLPRIYVNLAQANNDAVYTSLLGMAERLYRFMTPLAILGIAFGLWLYLGYGLGRAQGWMHAKLALVFVLAGYHLHCKRVLDRFRRHNNQHSHKYYRWYNELPVILLLLILILVVVRPF